MTGISDRLANLSPSKRALFERIAARTNGKALELEPIARRAHGAAPSPLSFAQQRLWFLDQLEGPSATYNMPVAVRLDGPLNRQALEQVFTEIVNRHEPLRSNFFAQQGQPIQVIRPTANLHTPFIDLSKLEAHEQELKLMSLSVQEAQTPFNLASDQLLRTTLIKFNDQHHVLLLTIHHIVSDGWSIGNVLLNEITTLYVDFSQGGAPSLAPLPIQYGDFAQWQREWLTGARLNTQIEYWKTQLNGLPALLELPTDHPRPALQSFAGETYHFSLDARLLKALKALSQASGTTLFMTLLAGFSAFLARYSNQTDVVVGSPIANRDRQELEPLVGFFANTLVFRTTLHPGMTGTELLGQVRETCLAAYQHQDMPFERLVEILKPERHASFSPLFQVMFVLQSQNQERAGFKAGELRLTSLPVTAGTSMFDLTLKLEEQGGELLGEFEYSTALFEHNTIKRFVKHYLRLLDDLVKQPEQNVSRLALMHDSERQTILQDWNATACELNVDQNICTLFEQQVLKRPEHLALRFGSEALTYSALDRRTNQLARYLISLGIGPEQIVGLALPRSLEMVIILLAVCKSGASYLPLDTDYPSARLAVMLADSRASLLITNTKFLAVSLQSIQPPDSELTVFDLNIQDLQAAVDRFAEGPLNQAERRGLYQPGHLAYLIYTSGSTGTPKGVGNTHSGLLNRLEWMQSVLRLTATDRVLQKTPYSFDVSVWEFFLPLCFGATLVIAKPDGHKDPHYLAETILQEQITTLHFVPSMLEAFLQTPLAHTSLNIRHLVTSGEALSDSLQQTVFAKLPTTKLWNLYGPTEAAIDVTYWECQASDVFKTPPIGRPIQNCQIYLLDADLNPVPLGVTGELYIAGAGLARGYLGRAGLTAERFIANPFEPGARMYRSGDLAYWTKDGVLIYGGRVDTQVKLRGFRIELGEIEAALALIPEIAQCSVKVQNEGSAKQLIAYLVAHAGHSVPDAKNLRQAIGAQLPSHMIPTAFLTLDRIPLTPNGKIDRNALPSPDLTLEQGLYVAPRRDVEQRLCEIWSALLGIERIGIQDNFFRMGGHSLLAVQLISKIRDEFGLELAVSTLFDCPTIEQLARTLAVTESTPSEAQPPQISQLTEQDKQHSALSFAQQRLWFLNELEGQNATYLISGTVRMTGRLEVDILERAFTELVKRHEALRTTFIELNGSPVARLLPPQPFKIARLSLEHLSALEQTQATQSMLAREINRPFDLTQEILLRVTLLRYNEASHFLILTLHHIISDNWSMALLQNEVVELYRAYSNDQASPLKDLPLQYSEYAQWQRHWFSRERLANQQTYWNAQLKDAPVRLDLPADHVRPAIASYRGKAFSFEISATLMDKVRNLTQTAGATLFMTLLSAWSTLLARHAGITDLVIGAPVSSRNRSELESLIGFFVNTLPLRIDLSGQPTSLQLIERIKKTVLGAFAHQDLPFEHMVEALKPERALSYTPVFQTMFVMQNAPIAELNFDSLILEMITPETLVSKFDLTLAVQERDRTLYCNMEFSTDLFEQASVERLAIQFKQLLTAMCEQPSRSILSLPLLNHEQWQDSTYSTQARHLAPQTDQSVLALFALSVAAQPQKQALRCAGQALSFADLNELANQLAYQLRQAGARANTVVGLHAEPSFEMIVGILGILKAGAAYLPLLPGTPSERVELMCAQSRVCWVLDATQTLKPLEASRCWPLSLDALKPTASHGSDPDWVIEPESLAYVIYTSGSTGQPKGVMVSHANLYHSTLSRLEYYQSHLSGLILLQPFSFDVASGNIFWTLCAGGTLFLEPRNLTQDPQQLLERLRQTQASHLVLLPLLYLPLLELASDAELANLNTVIVGGENMPAELVVQHHARARHAVLYNEYGPTETTVMCCAHRVAEPAAADWRPIPIGKALSPSKLYLLDEYLNPVPLGVAAELYIGGPQVSLGYQDQPAFSAERFLPDPFSQQSGARMYRSGDFARRRTDGNLEFIGRQDQQLKIRGFRVELGEIEASIKGDPAIAEVVVMAFEQGASKRLVAYLVLNQQAHLYREQALRQRLATKLPEYCIPSAFMLLEALPLTTNGKLDRRALPAPSNDSTTIPHAAPTTEFERQLANIWREVLKPPSLSIDDNFFMLGGDSILSLQIISRAIRLGIGLSVKQLFLHQTIRKLAAVATSVQVIQADQLAYAGEFSLLPIQRWFFENNPVNANHFNQSQLLNLKASVTDRELNAVFEALSRQHDMLRSRYSRNEQDIVAFILPDTETVDFLSLDLSHLEGQAQCTALENETLVAQQGLSISEGPLWKARRFHMGKGPDRLLWVIHHLAVDGVSWRILLEDLEAGLGRITSGQPITLLPKTSSLPLWSDRLKRHVTTAPMVFELDYWRAQTNVTQSPLPYDYPQVSARDNTLLSVKTIATILPADVSTALLTETAHFFRSQINDLLLTALLLTFQQWTHNDRLQITLEGHGREDLFEDVDLSRTVGWFTSGFPVLLKSDTRLGTQYSNLAHVVRDIKDVLRAVPNHGIGFGILRYLHPEPLVGASLAPAGRLPVSFNYLGQFKESDTHQFLLGQAPENAGPEQSSLGLRHAEIEINGAYHQGTLQFTWSFSDRLHLPATIERLASHFQESLSALVNFAKQQRVSTVYAVSDFPLAKLSREVLDRYCLNLQAPIQDIFPLSPMQQGMLFHSELNRKSGDYIIQLSCQLEGDLNLTAFEQAWQSVINRHDSLRASVFTGLADTPLQVIMQTAALPWSVLDWRDLPGKTQTERWASLIEQDRHTDFDPSIAPLMRCTIARISEQAWLFLWSHHHMLTDGWSLPILTKEVFQLYHATLTERHSLLPAAPQYRDYIAWLATRDLERARSYWQARLATFAIPTHLTIEKNPLTRSKETIAASAYQAHDFELTVETSDALRSLAQAHGLTLSLLIQGAWAVLLSRYSGSNDIVFGVTVSGRPPELSEVGTMIGLFINTLPLRVELQPQQRVDELLNTLKEEQLSREEFAYTPLVEVHRCSDLAAQQALFESIVIFENYPVEQELSQFVQTLKIEQLQVREQISSALTLMAAPARKLPFKLLWDSTRYDRDVVLRLCQHFKNLLTALPVRYHGLLGRWESELLDQAEQTRLTLTTPPDECMQAVTWLELLKERVKQTPDQTALSVGVEALTYQELADRVSSLSSSLRGLGVQPESLVALYLNRSVEMVVALLAVMQAGAAYIPLDPGYPKERLGWILEDAKPIVLLTVSGLVSTLPLCQTNVLRLDEDTDELERAARFGEKLPEVSLFGQNLAYVIFTSGSSGRPKGVQVSHQALLNFLIAMRDCPGLDATSTLLAVTTISFDIAALEIYLPLMTGARLVIATREAVLNGEELQLLMAMHCVTHMQATPTTWRLLLGSGWTAPQSFTLLCGGEALPTDLAQALSKRGATLWNLYGPTETTIWSALSRVNTESVSNPVGTEPIGQPIRHTHLYVLDCKLNLQPLGTTGELMIGGHGLARGYLGRPALTAEAYRPDPFSTIPGTRMYRTGDMVQKLNHGAYAFLGRADSQIKIRGYRIELSEIETMLRQLEGVQEAVVIAREGRPGEKSLIAYIAGHSHADESALRRWLRERLPEYMLPTRVLWLDQLPQTPNGKVDRNALMTVSTTRETEQKQRSHSFNPQESLILAIWRQVLDVEDIGPEDNFFELGGHSLLLSQVHKRLSHEAAPSLPLLTMLQNPTIASLSKAIDNLDKKVSTPTVRRTRVRSTTGDVAIVGMAGRFPGADNIEAFWDNLLEGRESIQFFSLQELAAAGIAPTLYSQKSYVPAHGSLGDIESFDAELFGFTDSWAQLIDPQHRVLMQVIWHTLEHAGYAKPSTDSSIGVFVGCGQNDYVLQKVLPFLAANPEASEYSAILGNERDFIATRISHTMDLTGPSLTIQTACSTSLVAVHTACRSVLDGDCDMAIAGGVSLQIPQMSGHVYKEGMINSPDGHCRAFDARAEGTVWGSGAGAVLLKPLEQALEDQDTIYAVIKGTAINNDGAKKSSFLAPSVEGQLAVIEQALARAGVPAETIDYIETHGTGTALGDVVEFTALQRAYETVTSKRQFCALGSVKTNVGHLNTASGIAGLCKVALAVSRGKIPATLHFTSPNPKIPFADSPFFVNGALRDWPQTHKPRRAGLSSFGIGGTNAHAIVEQPPAVEYPPASNTPKLLVLTAKTEHALETLRLSLAQHLRQTPDVTLDDLAWTLAVGRKAFEHRSAFQCTTLSQAIEYLEQNKTCAHQRLEQERRDQPNVVFMFSSQLGQSLDMTAALYREEAVFRQCYEECAQRLKPALGLDICGLLTGALCDGDAIRERLDEPWLKQPVLFAIEYALSRQWLAAGVSPNALLGEGPGEFVAACLAGIFDLPEALRLVCARSRLRADATDDELAAFAAQVQTCQPRAPTLDCWSALSGAPLTTAQGLDPTYWANQRQEPLLPNAGLEALLEQQDAIFIEIGPNDLLAAQLNNHRLAKHVRLIMPSLPQNNLDTARPQSLWLESLAKIWCAGFDLDWRLSWSSARHARIALPLYPFEKKRHWIDL